MRIERFFTSNSADVYEGIEFVRRTSRIVDVSGKTIFENGNVVVPSTWSQTAVDMLAQKYFRRKGVPSATFQTSEKGVPAWLWRSEPQEGATFSGETDARQTFHRLAGCWAYWGWKGGYFKVGKKKNDEASARAFYDEMRRLLALQMGSPNSPQWFNTGISWAYGIKGDKAGYMYADENGVHESPDSYSRISASACFINSVEDNLVEPYGIMDLWMREARIFKMGAGSGASYSKLRGKGEPLSGGGTSSGILSWLKIGDASGGSIKSGGTCLAPHTKVYTQNGPVGVKELAERNQSFICISYDPPARRFKAKWAKAWLAGSKVVVRVTTDKGEFELSYDHPMRMADGTIVKAGMLKSGTSLQRCSIDMSNNAIRVHLQNGKKGRRYLHRLIGEDILNATADQVVHHVDHNRLNNNIDNLELKTSSEHARDHAAELVDAGEHVFQKRKFPKLGDKNPMSTAAPFWQDKDRADALRAKHRDNMIRSGMAREMQSKACDQRMLEIAYRLINLGCDIGTFDLYVEARTRNIGRIDCKKRLLRDIKSRFGDYPGFLKALAANNHRVVSVDNVGEMDVYDVEVDCPTADDKSTASGHNFVIWPQDNDTIVGSGVVCFNTRRAARMVIVNIDHPDIEAFIDWKPGEEDKVAALVAGSRQMKIHGEKVVEAVKKNGGEHDVTLKALKAGVHAGVPATWLQRVVDMTVQGVDFSVAQFTTDWQGEAYQTVGGQNANNSVRLSNEFMKAVEEDGDWNLYWRTELKKAEKEGREPKPCKTIKARALWDKIGKAVWVCADPGVQFDDTINDWHTVPENGRINASNPCCFVGETLVYTDQGEIRIDELAETDRNDEELPEVRCCDVDKKEVTESKILRAWQAGSTRSLVTVSSENGIRVTCTPEHRFLVTTDKDRFEYIRADKLSSDYFMVAVVPSGNSPFIQVKSVEPILCTEDVPVYDLEVEGFSNFAVSNNLDVGAVIVHNSEYLHLDDTSCNLASLRLTAYYHAHGCDYWRPQIKQGDFDTDSLERASKLFALMLEITVSMGQFPSEKVARLTHDTRTLGLGYADVGALLMMMGLPYDSDKGRAVIAGVTAILHCSAYEQSALMAKDLGPFAAYQRNKKHMLRVIENHARAAWGRTDYVGVSMPPPALDLDNCPTNIANAASAAASRMVLAGKKHGFRNAQATVIAPTGCLVPETLVVTDGGLRRLGDLGDKNGNKWQKLDLRVNTGEWGEADASKFFVNGEAKTLIVRTVNGYKIQGTTKHKIRVQRDGEVAWCELANVKQGDSILLRMNSLFGLARDVSLPEAEDCPVAMTTSLAELVGGYMARGGGRVDSGGVYFQNRIADSGDRIREIEMLVKEAFDCNYHIGLSNGHRVLSLPRRVADWWKRANLCRMPSGKTGRRAEYRSRVPDEVLQTNDPFVYASFLRGLFRINSGKVPATMMTDEQAAQDVLQMLLAIGIGAHLEQKGRDHVFCGNYGTSDSWLIEVQAGVHRTRFARIMNPVFAGEPWNGDGEDDRQDILLEVVDSVKDGGVTTTFDLSVPGPTAYVANGFVSHNTIGLQMDCSTTGLEPDFALVKFKSLAGGGYLRIANQCLTPALIGLGYTTAQALEIERFVGGTGTLDGAPFINASELSRRGLSQPEIGRIEAATRAAFDMRMAVNDYVLEPNSRFAVKDANGKSVLGNLGYTEEEIEAANAVICGLGTIEGAPHIRSEHLPVFDCANKCGKKGVRFIKPEGHVDMLAVVTPVVSGAYSKTINCPGSVTKAEMLALYMRSWKKGVKVNALYRDGSKLSQPLNASWAQEEKIVDTAEKLVTAFIRQRRRLPNRRPGGITQKVRIAGQSIYLRTGEYADGTLGEIFTDAHKEGAGYRSLLNCFSIAISLGLQYGVPLDVFVSAYVWMKFEPNGPVSGHDQIKMCQSIVDYIFRELAITYLGRNDLANVRLADNLATTIEASTEELIDMDGSDSDTAVQLGFLGEPCGKCGQFKLTQSGPCKLCRNCGDSNGGCG